MIDGISSSISTVLLADYAGCCVDWTVEFSLDFFMIKFLLLVG